MSHLQYIRLTVEFEIDKGPSRNNKFSEYTNEYLFLLFITPMINRFNN